MKQRAHLLLLILLVPVTMFAQPRRGDNYPQDNGPVERDNSTLSIFSDNGEPFFLVLNGVKQNLVPQSKIRVESLPQYMTDVQIMFTDNRTPPLRKRITLSDPVDGKSVNLTLKIERGRSGYAKLKFHRMTQVDHNYHGPRDEYVMYYGKPQQINTVTETTYTDPITGQLVTQTTTTTTDNYSNNNNNSNYNTPPPPPPAPRGPVAMDDRTFNEVKQSITSASFEDTKMSTAKTVFGSNYMNTNQVMEICNMFSFENNKLTFAEFAYSRTVDQGNYFRVGSVFSFDSNKKALNDFISRGGR